MADAESPNNPVWEQQLSVALLIAAVFGVLIGRNAPYFENSLFLWLLFLLAAGLVLGVRPLGGRKRFFWSVATVTTLNGVAIVAFVIVGTLLGLTGLTTARSPAGSEDYSMSLQSVVDILAVLFVIHWFATVLMLSLVSQGSKWILRALSTVYSHGEEVAARTRRVILAFAALFTALVALWSLLGPGQS